MNLTTATTCFFKKCIDVGEILFKLGHKKTPREETLEAIEEAKRIFDHVGGLIYLAP